MARRRLGSECVQLVQPSPTPRTTSPAATAPTAMAPMQIRRTPPSRRPSCRGGGIDGIVGFTGPRRSQPGRRGPRDLARTRRRGAGAAAVIDTAARPAAPEFWCRFAGPLGFQPILVAGLLPAGFRRRLGWQRILCRGMVRCNRIHTGLSQIQNLQQVNLSPATEVPASAAARKNKSTSMARPRRGAPRAADAAMGNANAANMQAPAFSTATAMSPARRTLGSSAEPHVSPPSVRTCSLA